MAPSPPLEVRALLLLEDALDRPSDEREAWVLTATDDARLAKRVVALLRAERLALGTMRTGGVRDAAPDTPPPERIGAYRIVGLIGQGGMGAVYRGERVTGDFDHVAAIKVVKPGALSRRLVERFQNERQTLARLNHPNIARLLDGGATESGAPYIVMEYVDGVPILEWAGERSLGTAERLALFLQICDAVSYAHQNLIVHRDITPANVLVTADGTAKLIDFGISRLHEQGGEACDAGGEGGRSATPGFAAPERVTGGGANTLADVYSLGKLLEALLGDRGDHPDLTAILGKAAAPDPADRYATANALAQDIRRFLAGEPVLARNGGAAYRLARFVSRRRYAVGAAAAFLFLLVGALAATSWAYARAEAERADAERRFEDLRALARFQIFDLYDDLSRVAGNNRARVRLAAEAQRHLRLLADHPRATPAVRLETAQGFLRLARILGMPNEPNLGDYAGARRSVAEALALLAALETERPTDPAVAATAAAALTREAILLIYVDQRLDEAEGRLRAAARRLARVPAFARGAAWFEARRLVRLSAIELRDQQGRPEELLALARRYEDDIDEWPPTMQAGPLAARDRAYAQYWYGNGKWMLGRAGEAVPHFRAAKAGLAAIDRASPNDPWVLYIMAWADYVGFAAAQDAGRADEAFAFIRDAAATATRLGELQDGDASIVRLSLNVRETYARNLATRGRLADAIDEQRRIVGEQRRLAAGGAPSSVGSLAFSEAVLGTMERSAGRRDAACANWRNARRRLARLEGQERLTESFAALLPGLRGNVGICDSNGPAGRFVAVPGGG